MKASLGTMSLLAVLSGLGGEATEHLYQVPIAPDRDDRGDYRKGAGRNDQRSGPECLPIDHVVSLSATPRGEDRPDNEPDSKPSAAKANAMNPVRLSLQCSKKKGTMTPTAPSSIAR